MNKIYNIVWNSSTNQWTVASELAKAQGSAHSQSVSHTLKSITSNLSNVAYKLNRVTASVTLAVIAVFGSSFIATQAQAAECFGVVNSYVSASNGAACDVTGTNYNYIKTYNIGTVANVSAPNVSVYATASSNSATSADNGAVINFAGNLNSTATGNRHSVAIGYEGGAGTINVAGNLTATANAVYGRAIFMAKTGSTLNVGGNLISSTTGGSGGSAVVQNEAGTTLTVNGTTTITTTNANPVTGMRLFGNGSFGGNVVVNLASTGRQALDLQGTNTFNKNVTLNTTGGSSGGISQSSGTTKILGDLAITTKGADTSTGIDLTGGSLNVNGTSTVSTVGAGAFGVSTSGAGKTEFKHLTINTSGDNSSGVIVSGVNASSTLGNGSTVTTKGNNSHGVQVTDGALNFAQGEINTSGSKAYGIFVTNTTPNTMQFTTGTNVTTTGSDAHGVVLVGTHATAVTKAALTGNISATGANASGVVMQVSGTSADLSIGGTIKATDRGIDVTTNNNTNSDVIINTVAGKTIQAGGMGVRAVNDGTGAGNITITNNSAIDAGDYGIIAQNASTGSTKIDNTAVVNSGTVAVAATNKNTASTGDVSITSTDAHGVTAGIAAATVGTGNVIVTATGDATATGANSRGIEAVQNGATTGSVSVTTTAGKTVSGSEYGIRAIKSSSDDGSSSVTVANNANVSGGSYGIEATNYNGDVTVTNTGTVNAVNGLGISARSSFDSMIAVNTSGTVSGKDGILADSGGDSHISIDTSADITATAGIGITVYNATSTSVAASKVDIKTASGTTVQATDNAIDVTAGGTVNVTNAATLKSSSGNGIDVTEALSGSTINNSGDITATATGKFVIAGAGSNFVYSQGNPIDTVTTTGGTLTGNTDLGAGNDSFTASGGALVGNTFMGNGDDMATLTGTVDVTKAPQFDGGIGNDTLNIDGISMRGFTADTNDGSGNDISKGSNLTKWQTINVKNNGTLKLTGDIFTAEAEDPGTGGGGARIAASALATLNIDSTSTLDLKGNSPGIFTIFGDVNNSGMMTMADGAADDLTTITGNYTGVTGSQFAIDTVLGNDSSLTDKLVVNGNTSGTTALSVANAGGAGAPTVEGIQVVQVDGASDGTFSLAAPVQAGSYEYTLQKNGVSTPTDGDWYLRSTFVATCANTPSLCPVDPIDPVDPVDPPKPPVYIYRPGVALYVTAQSANADAGFLQMSTLHQRMGEQRDLPTDKPQTWGRLIGAGVSNAGGNRFEYDQFTTGFQFGHDLLHKTSSTGTQQRAGVTVQYAHSSMDAKDRVRPLVGLGEDTGSINSNSVGLGGYYTRMNQAGAYLDVVSQVNHLTNKFSDSYGGNSKQKGWQFGLSAEVGKPVADLGGWKFEPQAQLSYLLSKYSDFSDQYSNIDGLNAAQLRGRLGLRVYKDMLNCDHNVQYYGVLNLHHDFLKAKSITLNDRVGNGSASVRESYDRTFGEVGLGIQGQIHNNTYVYADARYKRSFKGNKEGAQFNVGIKASF